MPAAETEDATGAILVFCHHGAVSAYHSRRVLEVGTGRAKLETA